VWPTLFTPSFPSLHELRCFSLSPTEVVQRPRTSWYNRGELYYTPIYLWYLVCHMHNGVTYHVLRYILGCITHQQLHHQCFMRGICLCCKTNYKLTKILLHKWHLALESSRISSHLHTKIYTHNTCHELASIISSPCMLKRKIIISSIPSGTLNVIM
jgi:hypothetical protein